MKKIGATELDNEGFRYEDYYSEDDAVYDQFGAGGNSNFGDINSDFRLHAAKILDDSLYDIENMNYDDFVDDDDMDKEVREIISSSCQAYGSKVPSDNKLNYIANLIYSKGDGCRSQDENDIICELLEVLEDKKFITGTIHGNSQGDGMDYICPADMKDRVPYIESVLFATGTEFSITIDKCEESEIDDADCYNDYTDLGKEDDIKDWIAKNANVPVSEVGLRLIDSSEESGYRLE